MPRDKPAGTARRRGASANALDAAAPTRLSLRFTPDHALELDHDAEDGGDVAAAAHARITAAFARSWACGVLHLGGRELDADLPASLRLGRDLAKLFFTRLCAASASTDAGELAVSVPLAELEAQAAAAPPMVGAEYLGGAALSEVVRHLTEHVRREAAALDAGVAGWLAANGPAWHAVGRVHFHLAENKRDPRAPFAFLATYAKGISGGERVQHAPLGRALEEYAGAANKGMLLALLRPVQRAAETSAVVRGMVDTGDVFHPLAWTPEVAYAFLREIPVVEAAGVVVRVPDWWHARRPPRPQVKVTVGSKAPAGLGVDAMLDFHVDLTFEGETLTAAEWRRLLAQSDGLVLIKGRWAVVDRARLEQVLERWRAVERDAAGDGLSFLSGMRLLAGVAPDGLDVLDEGGADATPEWAAVSAGPWLEQTLRALREPAGAALADPGDDLGATLRPYQREGVAWLWLLSRLGLGACLADDMGLGKTLQVLGLLLLLKRHGARGPNLVVVPASLVGNWRAEAARFAPSLRVFVAHPSECAASDLGDAAPESTKDADVVITTYGTVLRCAWIQRHRFGVVALDEAQAIKNPDARQTRAVKALDSTTRLALTGTPIENRLTDLWSIFDFLCPGLLGSAKQFREFEKRLGKSGRGHAPLRTLVRPYFLRRMKTDRSIVVDLPDKIEVTAYCGLVKAQAALYARAVEELADSLRSAKGMQRRGLVLAFLVRFKQICNHPSQWLGDGAYGDDDSGKLSRLRELCEPIAARQERALVFTQFREMTAPLARSLARIFGREGLVLTGETPVKERAKRVAEFSAEDGPPFFVLSLKAGGTGLNLTRASHVIHFDRWWNPAVEDQATDRAFRLGQQKNVLVHKFVCRGTIEERIDAMIAGKRSLSADILAGGAEAALTEMSNAELLEVVSLDLRAALEAV
ncbi:MAG TPA: DEAD/DEAH box helicase [Byssovorax sp.]